MHVARRSEQQFTMVGHGVRIVTQDADSGGPNTMVFCLQQFFEQWDVHVIDSPAYPQAFELMVLKATVVGLEFC